MGRGPSFFIAGVLIYGCNIDMTCHTACLRRFFSMFQIMYGFIHPQNSNQLIYKSLWLSILTTYCSITGKPIPGQAKKERASIRICKKVRIFAGRATMHGKLKYENKEIVQI